MWFDFDPFSCFRREEDALLMGFYSTANAGRKEQREAELYVPLCPGRGKNRVNGSWLERESRSNDNEGLLNGSY